MKKVYQITKFVVAESVEEATKIENKWPVEEVLLTKHSSDILLDELHNKNKGTYLHMDGSVVCKICELTKNEGCTHDI